MTDTPAAGLAVSKAARGACEAVLAQYSRYVAAAESIDSPNLEDDQWVKLGIAGFSAHAPTERWTADDLRLFLEIRSSELTDDVLAEFGSDAGVYERFGCLCIGAVLGLMQLGAIRNEDELLVAQAAVAAFMTLNSQHIVELERP
jgi:hypothetical protein